MGIDQDARRARLEDHLRAFFDGLVSLAGRGHVLHVTAVDEGDFPRPLADGGARAVHRREAAADDDDAAAGVARVGQAQRGDAQVVQAFDHALGGVVGDADLVRVVAAGGDDRGVESPVAQVVQAEVVA